MIQRVTEFLAGFAVASAEDLAAKTGARWRVTLIREGLSLNGRFWPASTLDAAASMFEAKPAGYYQYGEKIIHLPGEAFEVLPGVIGNWVGRYENVTAERGDDGKLALTADLVVFESCAVIAERLREYAAAGWLDGGEGARIGLSVDVDVESHAGIAQGHQVMFVDAVRHVRSVDIVHDPAAGGCFTRLVAARQSQPGEHGRTDMNPKIKDLATKILAALLRGAESAGRAVENVATDAALLEVLKANLATRAKEAGHDMTALATLCQKALDACTAGKMDECVGYLETCIEVMSAMAPGDAPVAPPPAGDTEAAGATEQRASEAVARLEKLAADAEAREMAATAAARTAALIDAAMLPDAYRDALREEFAGRVVEAAVVEAAIKRVAKLAAAAPKDSPHLGWSASRHARAVEMGIDENEIKAIAVDKAFGLDPNKLPYDFGMQPRARGRVAEAVLHGQQEDAVRGLFVGGGTLAEARKRYAAVRAPQSWGELCMVVSGYSPAAADGREFVRAHESHHERMTPLYERMIRGVLPATSRRATEAITVNQSIYNTALSSSANRAVLTAFRAIPPTWTKFTKVESHKDFKAVAYLSYGVMPALSTLANDQTTYTDLIGNTVRTQESTNVTVARRGNVLGVTEMALRNDDLGLIQRVLAQLGDAGLRTIEQACADSLIGYTAAINDTVYAGDGAGLVLYHATHNNLSATALSAEGLNIFRRQMWAQTDPQALQAIGLFPEVLIVPVNLEATAFELVNTEQLPHTANNAKNIHYQQYEVVLSPYLRADTNNYYGAASPQKRPGIVVGVLDNQTEPEIFLNSTPTVGRVFTDDEQQWKIKFPFGIGCVDFRPLQGAIVA